MNQSRRRWVIGLAVALMLAIGALRLLRAVPGEHVTAAPADAERQGGKLAATAAAHAPPTHAPPARTGVTATAPPAAAAPAAAAQPTPTAGKPEIVSLAHATAEEYRHRARYPRWSQPIPDAAHDPILRARQVSPNVMRGPGGEEPSLTVIPEQVSFENPDPIIVYAYLSVGGAPVLAASISGAVMNQRGETVAPLPFTDSGEGGDAQAGDFVYTARVSPAEISTPLNGAYIVRVHAVTADQDDRIGTSGFLYSRPDAQLTGRYIDALRDGNLEIQAEAQVAAAGRFHLEATLYSQQGTPLAWAQNALQLAPGTQWVPLTFFGMILRESGADGPYVLRFVSLSTTTTMPNAKNRLVENAYTTGAYPAATFSDRPFNDPNLLETARRIEQGNQPHTSPEGDPGH